MVKIFKYELKRLIMNKFFFGLLIISAFYSHQVMFGDIIIGVANTAPFSGWSYGEYLAKVLPILLVALLFFISFIYSKQEKCVQVLTKATPIDLVEFQILRFGTIITALMLILAVPIVYSVYFYIANFHFIDFGSLILPTIVTLFPAIMFVFGLGVLGGRFHQGLIFIIMAVVLLVSFVSLPYSIDLFGGNFFKKYPASLDIVEPVFSIPVSVIIGKVLFSLSGLVMILAGCIRRKK